VISSTIEQDTDKRQSARSERHSARRILWAESKIKRVRDCGHHGVLPGGSVAVKVTGTGVDRRSGFSGLATCGSTWSCPVCSHKISSTRADDVATAIEKWLATHPENRVALLTLTNRHSAGQSLKSLWDVVSYAWDKVKSGRGWLADQDLYGSWMPRVIVSGPRRGELVSAQTIPFVRVVEVTHGKSGWHVHIHAVLVLGPTMVREAVSAVDVQSLGYSMFRRWRDALVRKGFKSPSQRRGVDIKLLSGDAASALGEYFAKATYPVSQSAGMEVTMGAHKGSKNGNRVPFGILADVVRLGDASDLDLWHEWEAASKGRRQLTWSTGLRDFLALGEELTDEQIAEDDLGGDVIVELSAGQWVVVRGRSAELLAAAEADDTGLALYALLADWLPLSSRDMSPVNYG
jgi:hypothetical protein